MKIGISVGHKHQSPGAVHHGHREHDEALILAGMLAKHTGGQLIGTGTIGQRVEQINRAAFDLVIEVHLNAGGGRGSETLHFPGSRQGQQWATKIEHAMRQEYHSRGAKPGTWRMAGKVPLKFLATTNCPAVIWEPFFMDAQPQFLGKLNEYNRMAKLVAAGIRG